MCCPTVRTENTDIPLSVSAMLVFRAVAAKGPCRKYMYQLLILSPLLSPKQYPLLKYCVAEELLGEGVAGDKGGGTR